jgi:hypothetical protein
MNSMNTTYAIWLCRPTGERVVLLSRFLRLEYRRAVNSTGYRVDTNGTRHWPLTLVLAWRDLPVWVSGSLRRDWRLEVWRGAGDGLLALDTETVWLIARVSQQVQNDGERVIEVKAVPALALLERRIVAYATGTPQAQKSGPADDLMRAIVRENFGSDAAAGRNVSAWLRVPSLADDTGAGAEVSKSFARRAVLDVLQELAEASAERGVALFFDVVCRHDGALPLLRFETYAQVRGADLARGNERGLPPVVLSLETGSLVGVRRTQDWSETITTVYVAGQGAKDARQVVEVADGARAEQVPFGRYERLVDARHTSVADDLAHEGYAALRAGVARDEVRGRIVSREPGFVYGRDWRFGDRVSVEFDGETLDCRVDAVDVVITPERETVFAEVRGSLATTVGSEDRWTVRAQPAPTQETEQVFQQVQQLGIPAGEYVYVPDGGQVVALGCYDVAGGLDVAGEVRVGA